MKYVSWVEKNRPNKIDDVCYQEDVKEGLKNFVKNKNIPHLLFLVLQVQEKHQLLLL